MIILLVLSAVALTNGESYSPPAAAPAAATVYSPPAPPPAPQYAPPTPAYAPPPPAPAPVYAPPPPAPAPAPVYAPPPPAPAPVYAPPPPAPAPAPVYAPPPPAPAPVYAAPPPAPVPAYAPPATAYGVPGVPNKEGGELLSEFAPAPTAPKREGGEVRPEEVAIPPNTRVELRDDRGQYSHGFSDEKGTEISEQGRLITTNGGWEYVIAKKGSYKYISPEGIPIVVEYVADENGFHPVGTHIPQRR